MLLKKRYISKYLVMCHSAWKSKQEGHCYAACGRRILLVEMSQKFYFVSLWFHLLLDGSQKDILIVFITMKKLFLFLIWLLFVSLSSEQPLSQEEENDPEFGIGIL